MGTAITVRTRRTEEIQLGEVLMLHLHQQDWVGLLHYRTRECQEWSLQIFYNIMHFVGTLRTFYSGCNFGMCTTPSLRPSLGVIPGSCERWNICSF